MSSTFLVGSTISTGNIILAKHYSIKVTEVAILWALFSMIMLFGLKNILISWFTENETVKVIVHQAYF